MKSFDYAAIPFVTILELFKVVDFQHFSGLGTVRSDHMSFYYRDYLYVSGTNFMAYNWGHHNLGKTPVKCAHIVLNKSTYSSSPQLYISDGCQAKTNIIVCERQALDVVEHFSSSPPVSLPDISERCCCRPSYLIHQLKSIGLVLKTKINKVE